MQHVKMMLHYPQYREQIEVREKLVEEIIPLDVLALKYVYQALWTNSLHRSKTAKQLGISIRTLRNYIYLLKSMGINV